MADCVACVISSGEIVSQLLLHCLIAYDLWVFFFCAIGITWVMLNSVKSILESWRRMMSMKLYGEQSQPVFYGAFGENEINGYLRGTRCL